MELLYGYHLVQKSANSLSSNSGSLSQCPPPHAELLIPFSYYLSLVGFFLPLYKYSDNSCLIHYVRFLVHFADTYIKYPH